MHREARCLIDPRPPKEYSQCGSTNDDEDDDDDYDDDDDCEEDYEMDDNERTKTVVETSKRSKLPPLTQVSGLQLTTSS